MTPNRCATTQTGRWEELPGLPGIAFMHAVLLPKTSRLLFWGYGPRVDQFRLWDQAQGAYTPPPNQPASQRPDQNLWSGAHAHLADAAGTIVAHGGMRSTVDPPITADTGTRDRSDSDEATSMWSATSDMHIGRFYPTTISLADGRPMTMYGADNYNDGTVGVSSLETFTPGAGGGSWSQPKPIPFDYFYYPWAFLLPLGDVFIAGTPEAGATIQPGGDTIMDAPAQHSHRSIRRAASTWRARPCCSRSGRPRYAPRVMIAGGTGATRLNWNAGEGGAMKIGRMDRPLGGGARLAGAPRHEHRARQAQLGTDAGRACSDPRRLGEPAGRRPDELFDPDDPTAGFQLGPSMKYRAATAPRDSPARRQPRGGRRPRRRRDGQRALPALLLLRAAADHGSPAAISYGQGSSASAGSRRIAEVVLMRPGAVTHGFNQNQRWVGCASPARRARAVPSTRRRTATCPRPVTAALLVDHDRSPSQGVWVRLS